MSRLHAHVELAEDGLVAVKDAGSSNGTFVKRNDSWIRIRRITLCIGDNIRFGDVDVTVERLMAVFGKGANTRLEAGRFPVRRGKSFGSQSRGQADEGPALNKPRRNPVTGKIEERSADTQP